MNEKTKTNKQTPVPSKFSPSPKFVKAVQYCIAQWRRC